MKEIFLGSFTSFFVTLSFCFAKLRSAVCNFKNYFALRYQNLKNLIKYFLSANYKFVRAFRNKWVVIWCCVSVVLITSAIVVLLNITINYYMLTYNGKTLGYTRNTVVVQSTINSIKSKFVDNEEVLNDLDDIAVVEVQSSNLFLSCLNKDELKTAIVDVADSIEFAYCAYIDNELLFATTSKKNFDNALRDFKDDRITLSLDINEVYDSCEVEILNDFSTSYDCVLSEELTSKNVYQTFYELCEEELKYRIICLQTETVDIPYVTYYERNDNLYSGSRKVVRQGKKGSKSVQSKLVVENGELISSQVVDEKIFSNPVTKRIQIGNGIIGDVSKDKIFLLPVEGYVTSGYGDRADPFTSEQAFHNGLDISAAEGTPIIAALGGKIIQASDKNNGFGKCIIIEHYTGFRTLYAHASELLVSVGDYVEAGQTVALVGSTGRSTGPHLHFSVYIDGKYVDPSIYF